MKTFNLDQGVGQMLDDCYIEQLLSHGRRSAVYRGRQQNPDRSVALMVFLVPDATSSAMRQEFCDRFLQEAPTLMKLRHPHLLPFYGHGEWEGFPYLITPYTTEGSLAARIVKPWQPASILPLLEQVTVGLEYAHSNGRLHGMLSPANLLLRGDESFQVAAIGLRHLFENRGILPHVEDTKNLCMPRVTSKYIAPEYHEEQTVTIRSDIYSLGVILVELLSGHMLPDNISAQEILSQLDQCVPAALEPVLQQALAPDPAQRFRRMSNLFSAYASVITPEENKAKKSQFAPARTPQSQALKMPLLLPGTQAQPQRPLVHAEIQQRPQEYAETQRYPQVSTDVEQRRPQGYAEEQPQRPPLAYYPTHSDRAASRPSIVSEMVGSEAASSLFSIPKIKTDLQKNKQKKTIRRRQVTAILAGSVVMGLVGVGGLNLAHAFTTKPQAQAAATPTNGVGRTTQPVNSAIQFIDKSVPEFRQRLLIHMPDGNFVAYKQGCTHTGVLVEYNPKTHLLVCPAHGAIFDPAKNGSVVTGPTTISLPKVAIHVMGNGAITLA